MNAAGCSSCFAMSEFKYEEIQERDYEERDRSERKRVLANKPEKLEIPREKAED